MQKKPFFLHWTVCLCYYWVNTKVGWSVICRLDRICLCYRSNSETQTGKNEQTWVKAISDHEKYCKTFEVLWSVIRFSTWWQKTYELLVNLSEQKLQGLRCPTIFPKDWRSSLLASQSDFLAGCCVAYRSENIFTVGGLVMLRLFFESSIFFFFCGGGESVYYIFSLE